MGYDKADLAFVVHFQAPGSVVSYYQQVGRAGRGVDHADVVLLRGGEDRRIQDFFIEQAFPSRERVRTVLDALDAAPDGLTTRELMASVNLGMGRLEAMLKILDVEGAVRRSGTRWTAIPDSGWAYDAARYEQVTALRRAEQEAMAAYGADGRCLMRTLQEELDDPDPAGREPYRQRRPRMAGQRGARDEAEPPVADRRCERVVTRRQRAIRVGERPGGTDRRQRRRRDGELGGAERGERGRRPERDRRVLAGRRDGQEQGADGEQPERSGDQCEGARRGRGTLRAEQCPLLSGDFRWVPPRPLVWWEWGAVHERPMVVIAARERTSRTAGPRLRCPCAPTSRRGQLARPDRGPPACR